VTAARRPLALLAVCVLLAAVLGGQAVADSRVPARAGAASGAAIGRAGFAYLTGLRRFAALLIWNRLEPQFHGYYSTLALKDERFLLPNMRIVTLLDPQFIQSYYMVPWILVDNGKLAEAMDIAREGVANNPDSGLLHTSLAQLMYLKTQDLNGAVAQADLAMRPDQVWADATEQWQSMKILIDIYTKAGEPAKADAALLVTKELESRMGAAPGFLDPDAQF
jgi:tetratricopeptide (TPR) repeat protein